MDVELIVTGDGSHTLFVPVLKEHYHSTFGAIRESKHIFINSGLLYFPDQSELTIFEAGFGTGLNALLTIMEAKHHGLTIKYFAVEPYPPEKAVYQQLNYPDKIGTPESLPLYNAIHETRYNIKNSITSWFSLVKIKEKLEDIILSAETVDLVYFDVFSPTVQPELWTEKIFRKLFDSMKKGGILVTYSVKGSVKRSLKNAGFLVEKLPGPPGKREITRALKT
jgi:tRNA U34 5-methylaminomethyl-2-thiouridine-forming methyltransferase MnmC